LEYSDKICDLIKVKKYGKPIGERFAFQKDYATGYSLVQLIESSSITGHFSELWNRAFINIFSCKLLTIKLPPILQKIFFKTKKIKNKVLIR